MKKIISLLLVLCLIFALAPAAFADMVNTDDLDTEKEKKDFEDAKKSAKYVAYFDTIFDNLYFLYGDEADGILKSDGHLVSCSGGDCNCFATLYAAEKEARAQEALDKLRVWINSKRDSDKVLHDRIIAEVDQPYSDKYISLNQDYLDGNEAISELLEEFCDSDKLSEKLYLPSDFIITQIENCLELAEDNRSSGVSHLEYRLMAPGPRNISGVGIDFIKDGARDGGKEYMFSRKALDTECEHDVAVRVGSLVVFLPEDVGNAAFTLGVGFNYDGSVRVLLCDESGKLIPGAAIAAALPEGADADSTKVTVDGSPADEFAIEGGCALFTAPTGDDVFALAN